MRFQNLAVLASACAVASAQNLTAALSGEPSLSQLADLLKRFPDVAEYVASQEGVTFFAPNNEALESIVAEGGIFSIDQASQDPRLVEVIFRFHLYRGIIKSQDITTTPQFPHGYLNYSVEVKDGEVAGANVTGGQVVQLNLDDEGNAIVTSAIKTPSNIVIPDIEYDNGVIHTIDELLTTPLSISETLISGNFTALAGAATQAGLVPTLEGLTDVTVFAPNNEAFQALAATGAEITDEQLAEILKYHVIQGTVGYSTVLSNISLPTLNGADVQITITPDGAVFANSARVINANVLIANGVLHVIDEVLNPETPGLQASATGPPTTLAPEVPFTSDFPATSVFSELAATTSFVAAGLVTGTPSAGNASGNGSATTGSVPPVYTGGVAGSDVEATLWASIAGGVMAIAFFCR